MVAMREHLHDIAPEFPAVHSQSSHGSTQSHRIPDRPGDREGVEGLDATCEEPVERQDAPFGTLWSKCADSVIGVGTTSEPSTGEREAMRLTEMLTELKTIRSAVDAAMNRVSSMIPEAELEVYYGFEVGTAARVRAAMAELEAEKAELEASTEPEPIVAVAVNGPEPTIDMDRPVTMKDISTLFTQLKAELLQAS
jgi:hypothetical protein